MQLNEDLQIELEALQATYDSALIVDDASGGSSGIRGSAAPTACTACTNDGSDVLLSLRLQLAPQTGGDESSVFVLVTLAMSVGNDYPQQPPDCRLVAAKGATRSVDAVLMQHALCHSWEVCALALHRCW